MSLVTLEQIESTTLYRAVDNHERTWTGDAIHKMAGGFDSPKDVANFLKKFEKVPEE